MNAEIFIPCYRSSEVLEKCLTHIMATGIPASLSRVSLIINGKHSSEELKRYQQLAGQFPQVSITRLPSANRSLARNEARKIGEADHFIFLDSDVLIPPDFLNHVESSLGHYDLVSFETEPHGKTGVLLNLRRKVSEFRKRNNPVGIFNSAAMAIRRDAFLELGGFDDSYERCEDTDLFFRALKMKMVVGLHSLPGLKVLWDKGILSYLIPRPFRTGLYSYKLAKEHGLPSNIPSFEKTDTTSFFFMIMNLSFIFGFMGGKFKASRLLKNPGKERRIVINSPTQTFFVSPELSLIIKDQEVVFLDIHNSKTFRLIGDEASTFKLVWASRKSDTTIRSLPELVLLRKLVQEKVLVISSLEECQK